MRSRIKTWSIAASLFTALAMPVGMAAQDTPSQSHNPRHQQYTLIDLGTFGGPQSIIFGGTGPLSGSGAVTTCADTAMPDPYYPNNNPYFNLSGPDPYIEHAFLWRDGVLNDLGTLPGGPGSCGQWVNNSGVVVGASANGAIDPLVGWPEINAVRWRNGSILNLGTLGGNESVAFAINNRGEIAGGALNTVPDSYQFGVIFPYGATQVHAFLWRDGTMKDLGTLGGPDSNALYLNETGDAAGLSYTNNIPNPTTGIPTADPFLWKDNGMIDLGTLGGVFGLSNGLNNRSQVIGQSDLAGDTTAHPFFWDRGILTDIGTLGGDNGSANGINEAGEVVGTADLADGTHHAFIWRRGRLTDVGTVGADPCSNGVTINSAGQAMGTSTDCHGNVLHLFLWENGSTVNLSALIRPGSDITLTDPVMINDRGEIAGTGVTSDGNLRAALLVPDGDCDSDCENRITASQNNASPAQNPMAMTQGSESQLTPIERIRSMMRQRHHLPGQPAAPRD